MNPEPLHGSVRPAGRPARLLGAEEVEELLDDDQVERNDEEEGEEDDDRHSD